MVLDNLFGPAGSDGTRPFPEEQKELSKDVQQILYRAYLAEFNCGLFDKISFTRQAGVSYTDIQIALTDAIQVISEIMPDE